MSPVMRMAEMVVSPTLEQLELQAQQTGLLLRVQMARPAGIWTLRLVVAEPSGAGRANLLGELKGWAYPGKRGFQLDTMRVLPKAPPGVGPLIWAATMAWAREVTPCREARLLAIDDDPRQHRRLVRYFRSLGFVPTRLLGAAPFDLPLRLIWGGAGQLMVGDCDHVFRQALRRWGQVHPRHRD